MRREDLRRLIELEEPFDALLLEAEVSTEDSAVEPIHLRRADLDRALTQYIEGRLTELQLQRWAAALEMRESIDYEADPRKSEAEVLFHLATPEINGPLSPEHAERLRASLRSASIPEWDSK